MKNYVGIDLGTTNSAICSYDGDETRIWKSPEQNDVTPSAIYIDKRGNKYIGKRAYDSAPISPENAATGFKRFMGTSTPMELPAVNLTMTPEECSAEVLRALYGYVAEEIRNDPETGTVITVPAAFNQMQKTATMKAAELAGIGQVALMQEPVAAVMSVMRARSADGVFIIYDLGGGTLDVALAQSHAGRVNLLAHGGKAMCGGRDFDRGLLECVVKPWLLNNFDLPEDFSAKPEFKQLVRLATWAAERAKVELSARDEAIISLSEMEARVRDRAGQEIYVDIPITREDLDSLIDEKIQESIDATKETLANTGYSPDDIDRIVFIGGPTSYKPLRDKVSSALGIPGSSDINPMTAVAEGAAVFAESIDWASNAHGRKSARGSLASAGAVNVEFSYTARTPASRAKIAVKLPSALKEGAEFQVDSLDTGWTSGRLGLTDGATVDVTLAKSGENFFQVFVFDSTGGPIKLADDRITITRTAATVGAIPASHSIGMAVLDRLGGTPTTEWLVRAGDQLPRNGSGVVKAAESLKAGSPNGLNFKIYEGESDDFSDNRFIGLLNITGADFDSGVIPAGADLEYQFQMLDSGNIVLEVSVPSIGSTFRSGRNFYSPQEATRDFSKEGAHVIDEASRSLSRADEMAGITEDERLNKARKKLERAASIDPDEVDAERTQGAMEDVYDARRLLSQVRRDNLKEIRLVELNNVIGFFDDNIRQFGRASENSAFDNLARTAQRSIDRNDSDFENQLGELRQKVFEILWRQDWFVVERFKWMASSPQHFSDTESFEELVRLGMSYLEGDDVSSLRQIVAQLEDIRIDGGPEIDILDIVNIVRR